MRFVTITILVIILIGVSIQIYFMLKERNQLSSELDDINNRLSVLAKENNDLQSDIQYFSYPENLEKELRAKFNYIKPGEKMLIITP